MKPKNSASKSLTVWIVIFLVVIGLSSVFSPDKIDKNTRDMTYTAFVETVEKGEVKNIKIQGQALSGELKNGQKFISFAPEDAGLVSLLEKNKVEITALPVDEDKGGFTASLISWLPMVLFIAIWLIMMKQMMSSNGKALNFGKSKARLMSGKDKVTFDDVAGIEEAKQELQEIVDFLKAPAKFQRLGGKIPKGALLVGPPGTGKTLLAKAIAGEANVPFFSISGSDFVEMFVGVGASRVRDMFEQAKKSAPCIVFVDEIDAVGRHRGAGLGGGNDER